MKKLIHNLKQKPERVRQMIALVASLSITGVIALVWVMALIINGPAGVTRGQVADGAPSPLAVLKDNISTAIKVAGNGFASVGSSIKNDFVGTTSATTSADYVSSTTTDDGSGQAQFNY